MAMTRTTRAARIRFVPPVTDGMAPARREFASLHSESRDTLRLETDMTKFHTPPNPGDWNGEPPTASDPLNGKVLGERYNIDRVIGHGGMGTVYEARQIGLRRRVAIK